MLTKNTKLTTKLLKNLRRMPITQRFSPAAALEEQYKEVPAMENVNFSTFTAPEVTQERTPLPSPSIEEFDMEMVELVQKEIERQQKSVDLIASSNIPIPGVNEFSSHLANKSSPGFPNGRFFTGDSVIDAVERLCYSRALAAFDLNSEEWSVNVQALSGSLANLAAFNALCEPGDTILALDPKVGGGHHTYGLKDFNNKGTNIYSKMWNIEHYGVDENGMLDYEAAYQRALELKPKLIVAGASSYPRDIDYERFRRICDETGSILMADIAHGFGLSLAKVCKSPFPYADIVTASASKSMRGPRAGVIYCKKQYSSAIDLAVFPGVLGAPQNNLIGSLATTFKYCMTPQYTEYAQLVVENCRALADELQLLGNKVVTGGTDTNIMLWDIKGHMINAKTLTDLGEACNIQFNGVTLPNDKGFTIGGQGGVRFGTNVITARGYQPEDCRQVARYLSEIALIGAKCQSSEAAVAQETLKMKEIAQEVENFAVKFPLPGVTSKYIF